MDLREIHMMELFGEELQKLRLAKGDLLVVEGNGSPSEIGRMAVWDGTVEECVHQNHIIRIRCDAQVNPKFVEAFWNSPAGSERIKSVASSTSGLYTLSVAKVRNVAVSIPPRAAQDLIVAEIERRLSVTDSLEANIAHSLKRAERLRQSVLKRAFEGKLVPQDPDDEPASVLLESIRAERARTPVAARRRGRKKQTLQLGLEEAAGA